VVTSLADAVSSTDDAFALSLREAVMAANAAQGEDSIWLPAWHFKLSANSSNAIDEAFALEDDLDILDSTKIVGVSAALTKIEKDYLDTYSSGANPDKVLALYPFHRDHSVSLATSRLTTIGDAVGNDLIPTLPAPESAPSVPGELQTPKLPAELRDVGGVDAPQVAELTRTAGPDESLTISGFQLSQRTGEAIGSDTRVMVYGQGADGRMVFAEASVLRVDGEDTNGDTVVDYHVAMVTLPESLPAWSTYMVWVGNEDGWSAPQLVNKTEAWWVGPNIVRPGEKTSIFGRNLAHGNATDEGPALGNETLVYIEGYDANGDAIGGQQAVIDSINPYRVDFTVPANLLSADSYKVWIHNGHGGKYGWSTPIALDVDGSVLRPLDFAVEVHIPTSGPPGHLNYPILKDLDGDGDFDADSDNDQKLDLQEWINQYKNSNVTLVLPAGTLELTGTIYLQSGVSLRGHDAEDPSATVLKYTGSMTTNALDNTGMSNAAISDLTINASAVDISSVYYSNISSLGAVPQNIAVDNVVINAGAGMPFDLRTVRYASLTRLDVSGRESMISGSQIVIDQVDFTLRDDAGSALSFRTPKDLSVTNSSAREDSSNTRTTYGRFLVVTAWENGVTGVGATPENIYVGNNATFDLSMIPTEGVNINKGEQILFEGPELETSAAVGDVVAVDSEEKTITFRSRRQLTAADLNAHDAYITVIDGKGVGQYRRLHESLVLVYTDPSGEYWDYEYNYDGLPWNVTPDTSSTIGIQRMTVNAVVHNNELGFKEDAKKQTKNTTGYDSPIGAAGIVTYAGSINFIADGNKTQGSSAGLLIFSGSADGNSFHTDPDIDDDYSMPVFWVSAVNNQFGVDLNRAGEDFDAGEASTAVGIILIHGVPDGGLPYLGLTLRDNVIRTTNFSMEDHEPENPNDIVRQVEGVGIMIAPYEGWGTENGSVWFTADHAGPAYTTIEGNDIVATHGFMTSRLMFSPTSTDPRGVVRVAEGYSENLVLYNNVFDSGTSLGVKMTFNIETNYTDMVSGYPAGTAPLPITKDIDSTSAAPAGYRFFVLLGNQFSAGGPIYDFGLPTADPTIGEVVVAPLSTLRLTVSEGQGLSNLKFRIWNAGTEPDSIDSISSNVSWLGTPTWSAAPDGSPYWDIEFDLLSESLTAGEEEGVFTVEMDSGLIIKLSVFLLIEAAS
jgi:hypothetical protein